MAINSFLLETGDYLETLQAVIFFFTNFVNDGFYTVDLFTSSRK